MINTIKYRQGQFPTINQLLTEIKNIQSAIRQSSPLKDILSSYTKAKLQFINRPSRKSNSVGKERHQYSQHIYTQRQLSSKLKRSAQKNARRPKVVVSSFQKYDKENSEQIFVKRKNMYNNRKNMYSKMIDMIDLVQRQTKQSKKQARNNAIKFQKTKIQSILGANTICGWVNREEDSLIKILSNE